MLKHDLSAMSTLGHELRGMSGMLGVQRLAEKCGALEASTKANSFDELNQRTSSSFHQNGYKIKRMDFFAWQGARRWHRSAYGNDEQRCHAEKDAVLCNCFDETDY